MDWLRKGGSYFQAALETDIWHTPSGDQQVRFWREPLSALCTAATDGRSTAVTVLINTFTSGESVPEHTHDVEEVLLVTVGECIVTVDGQPEAARTGDAVIIRPGTSHAISHNDDEPCTVIAVLASPDAQVGATK